MDLHTTGITFMSSDTEGNRVTNFSSLSEQRKRLEHSFTTVALGHYFIFFSSRANFVPPQAAATAAWRLRFVASMLMAKR